MDEQLDKIKAIEAKIVKLIQLNKSLAEDKAILEMEVKKLTDENNKMKAEMISLGQVVAGTQEKVAQLEETNKTLNLATNVTEEAKEENKFLKTRLDDYVKEIDKCLAMLNS